MTAPCNTDARTLGTLANERLHMAEKTINPLVLQISETKFEFLLVITTLFCYVYMCNRQWYPTIFRKII